MLISGYESEFKKLLKPILNSDSEYKKLMEKCIHRSVNTEDIMYHIDT